MQEGNAACSLAGHNCCMAKKDRAAIRENALLI